MENRTNNGREKYAKRHSLPPVVEDAILTVLHYLWDEEKGDAESCLIDKVPIDGHIFVTLTVIRGWLEGNSVSIESYFDDTPDGQVKDICHPTLELVSSETKAGKADS